MSLGLDNLYVLLERNRNASLRTDYPYELIEFFKKNEEFINEVIALIKEQQSRIETLSEKVTASEKIITDLESQLENSSKKTLIEKFSAFLENL